MTQNRLVPRHPLAWGITKWGPLPGTADMWLLWGGPGDGLMLLPSAQAQHGQPVRHPAASGVYQTVAEAEKAVNAFVTAGLEAGADEE